MDTIPNFYSRQVEKTLQPWLNAKEGIMLSGARQVGKSTLLKKLTFKISQSQYFTFDDRETLLQAKSSTQGFLERAANISRTIFLDEFQKVPDITTAVKYLFDKHATSGQPIKFFLSGSISDALAAGGDSMAGRVLRFPLFSLSFAEYLAAKGIFSEEVPFDPKSFKNWRLKLVEKTAILSSLAANYLLTGGYPATVNFDNDQFKGFFPSIETAFLEKDLLGKINEGQLDNLRKVAIILAKRVCSPIAINNLASELGVDGKTIKRLLDILRFSYWIEIVYSKAEYGSQFKNKFKIYFYDTGLRNFLAGENSITTGPVLENAVFGVLRRYLSYRQGGGEISFWHRYNDSEVDFLATINQEPTAIEVKNQNLTRPTVPRSIVTLIETKKITQALVINQNFWDEKIVNGVSVYFLPFWFFAMVI